VKKRERKKHNFRKGWKKTKEGRKMPIDIKDGKKEG
jgi:hypothetical protein